MINEVFQTSLKHTKFHSNRFSRTTFFISQNNKHIPLFTEKQLNFFCVHFFFLMIYGPLTRKLFQFCYYKLSTAERRFLYNTISRKFQNECTRFTYFLCKTSKDSSKHNFSQTYYLQPSINKNKKIRLSAEIVHWNFQHELQIWLAAVSSTQTNHVLPIIVLTSTKKSITIHAIL